MFVPTMTIPEAIAEAKADLVSVQRKLMHSIQTQEREHRKNRRGGDIVGKFTYVSPRDNNWLYVITTNKKQSFHNVLMWYRAKEGLCGLQLAHEGLHNLFMPHFFTQYRARMKSPITDPEENLRNFFFRNPAAMIMRTGKEHLGFPAAFGSVPDGYVLGTVHDDLQYVRCRTFVDHTRAFKNQKEDHEALELVRLLRERYPALLAQAAAEERVKKEEGE